MKRDKKRFDPAILLYEAGIEMRRRTKMFLEKFPTKEKDLFKYHLVVLGDIDSVNFSQDQMRMIKKYVGEEGGAVIFIPGRRFGPAEWNDTPLKEVLPVVIETQNAKPVTREQEIFKAVKRPVFAKRTEIGERHPLLYISENREETRLAWEKHLAIYAKMNVERAKPGVQVLLETREPNPMPVIVYSRYGSGTVVFMGTDELWRWRYQPGPLSHDRFWGSVLEQVALARLLGESRRITLQLSREELGAGEEQTINARVLGENFQPAVEESIDVTVAHEDEKGGVVKHAATLNSIGKGTGLYEGKYTPGKKGEYTVTLAYGGDKVSAGFRATEPQVEYENPALDRDRLASWAGKTGGNVYDPWDVSGLPDEVAAKERPFLVRTEDELWDAPLWIFIFILFAGTEWFMRKRENLP
jgi:uncharacterized membrane protein